MVRYWLRDSGAVLAFAGFALLLAPFTFGVGGILVIAGIALLATWGLFSLVVYAYNGITRTVSAVSAGRQARPRIHRHRHA